MLTIFRPFGTSHLAPLVTAVPVGTHPRRKPSISARVGAVSGPRRVTLMAPAAFARAAASVHDRPDARSARSTPVCVSPAPLVSTGRRGWPGRYAVRPPLRTTHPRGPSRTIVTASGEILVATTAAVSSMPETPASAEASSALLVHTEVRARTASRVAGYTSAKVAPGSRTTTTPCGRVSSHSTRGSRVRPTREYPLTQTRSPAVGAAADSDWTVMWRSAPCVVTKDRSAVGSTSTTHTPVSRPGTGARSGQEDRHGSTGIPAVGRRHDVAASGRKMGHFQNGIHQRLRGVDDSRHAPKYAGAPPDRRGLASGPPPGQGRATGHPSSSSTASPGMATINSAAEGL